jgi:acyl carrier protein
MADNISKIKAVLGDVLSLGNRSNALTVETQLLGGIPEFDSMAVVAVVTALEDEFGILIDDDELSAEVFATVGTLAEFVRDKLPA